MRQACIATIVMLTAQSAMREHRKSQFISKQQGRYYHVPHNPRNNRKTKRQKKQG